MRDSQIKLTFSIKEIGATIKSPIERKSWKEYDHVLLVTGLSLSLP